MHRSIFSTIAAAGIAAVVILACGSSSRDGFGSGTDRAGTLGDAAGSFEGGDSGAGGAVRDPATCEEALAAKSYVGCDYWPTVTANLVQDVFDFAVAVANVGTADANITVTGPNGVSRTARVAGGSLEKIYLPWVPELKGGSPIPMMASVLQKGGAYHLVSSIRSACSSSWPRAARPARTGAPARSSTSARPSATRTRTTPRCSSPAPR